MEVFFPNKTYVQLIKLEGEKKIYTLKKFLFHKKDNIRLVQNRGKWTENRID